MLIPSRFGLKYSLGAASTASGMLHGGHEVESGVRYILVCFVILKNFANFATRFYQAVRDEDPEEFEPLPPGIEGVDSA